MAINLATKYSSKIAEKFTKESYVKGNTCSDYDFIGAVSYTHLDVYKRQQYTVWVNLPEKPFAMGKNTFFLLCDIFLCEKNFFGIVVSF